MSTLIHERVELARNAQNPAVVCRVRSGWVVMGDHQILCGYCLLLPDPVVPSLNDLEAEARQLFLYEMSVVGDALLEITDAYRINYGILGNLEPALHAHVFPRYMSEPGNLRQGPAWRYDWEAAPAFDPARDGDLVRDLAVFIEGRIG